MSAITNINILLLEDIPTYRNGSKLLLEKNIPNATIYVAANYEEATSILFDANIDVAFLDIELSGKSAVGITGSNLYRRIRQKEGSEKTGFDVLDFIRSNKLNSRAVMLSGYIDESLVLHSLKEGASGYIFKDQQEQEGDNFFYEAVNTVLRDRIFLLETSLGHNKERDVLGSLNTKEQKILIYICEDYKSQQIADKVYLSDSTVRGITSDLLKKFDVKSKVELKSEAIRRGLYPPKS